MHMIALVPQNSESGRLGIINQL